MMEAVKTGPDDLAGAAMNPQHLELLPLAQPGPLTEMERFMWECWGYLLINDVLTEAECDEALEASKRIHGNQPAPKFRSIGRAFETEPALERLIDHPAVFPKVRALYNDRFVLQSTWCTVQPAYGKQGTWHQDGSNDSAFGALSYPQPLIQLRVSFALTDQSEAHSGNMLMIPGSHRSPLPLPKAATKQTYASPIQHIVRVKRGAVLMFHNGVWHAAMDSHLDYDRYNMHFVYSPPWLRRADRDATDPAWLARTTPVRRALAGDFDNPEAPFAGPLPAIPFED